MRAKIFSEVVKNIRFNLPFIQGRFSSDYAISCMQPYMETYAAMTIIMDPFYAHLMNQLNFPFTELEAG